jgi:hypothetical protein
MKQKDIEGHGLMIVSRSDYTIIGGKRYLKSDSERVVLVRNYSTRKRRYFRKTSPLIRRVGNSYFLKKDCVYLSDKKRWACSYDVDITTIGELNYLSANVVKVDGKSFYFKDDKIVRDDINSSYIYKSLSVPLHPEIYGENKYTIKADINNRPLVMVDGSKKWARESDTLRLKKADGKISFILNSRSTGSLRPCFVGFVNEDNKIFDRGSLKNGVCYIKDIEKEKFSYHDKTDKYVHIDEYKEYSSLYKSWYDVTQKASLSKAITYANKRFGDKDDKENIPDFMSFDKQHRKPPRGGEMGANYMCEPLVSSTTVGVGGIGYSYGVEIETSNGYLSNKELEAARICVMGDNSINGNEYVTPPLHGDLGLEYLEKAFKIINSRCVVDDTCSLHVHVGGLPSPKVLTPDFNVKFAVNSIQLGCQVEESLFLTQPKARSPFKKHCHSITQAGLSYSGNYSMINMNNYKELLGDYVFGATIGEDVTRMSTPSRWGRTRYKWLNLRNAVSNTKIKTIEFRIFAPTTDYWKALQAIRISLAFTWFVENRKTLISKGGLTIHNVLEEAFKNKQEVLKDVMNYVETRSKKFKRNIYGQK